MNRRESRRLVLVAMFLLGVLAGGAQPASAMVPTPLFAPDDPPRAALIHLSTPDAAGEVP